MPPCWAWSALGTLPIAAPRDASISGGTAPWVAAALAGRPMVLLDTTEGLPFERIAALRPDLIVATPRTSAGSTPTGGALRSTR